MHRGKDSPKEALIVDDDEWVRLATRAQLEDSGWTVWEAADAQSGVDNFAAHPDSAFVLLDVRLPGMDTETTVRRLREIRADVPVLVFTGLDRWHIDGAVFSLGGVGYMPKPFTLEELAAALADVGVRL